MEGILICFNAIVFASGLIVEACSTRGAPKVRSPPNAAQLGLGGQPILPGAGPGHSAQQTQHQQTPGSAADSGNATTAPVPHFDCPSAYQKWYCLNEATCFAVKIGDTILYNCKYVHLTDYIIQFIYID